MPQREPPDRWRKGQSLVEYALILVLVVLVVIAGLGVFGGAVNGLYTRINANF